MDKLTAKIIQEQMIGQTNGHMAAIPNNPIMFSMFEVYCDGTLADRDWMFAEFLKEISEALKEKEK